MVVGFFEASVYVVATGRSIGPKGPGSVCSGIANPFSVNVWTGPAGSKGWTEYQSWGIARVSRIGKDLLPSLDSDGTQISNTTSRGFDCIPIYGDIVGWGTHAV